MVADEFKTILLSESAERIPIAEVCGKNDNTESMVYLDNVSLTVIPEPSITVLLFGGLASISWLRRRRN